MRIKEIKILNGKRIGECFFWLKHSEVNYPKGNETGNIMFTDNKGISYEIKNIEFEQLNETILTEISDIITKDDDNYSLLRYLKGKFNPFTLEMKAPVMIGI